LPSEEVVVAAPTNTLSPALTSNAPEEGVVDSVSIGAWTGDPASYFYQWERCNEAGEECTEVEGAESETYAPTAADVGSTIRAVVTAASFGGSAVASTEASAVVSTTFTAPLNVSPPEITGTRRVGQFLTVSAGEWAGTPRPSYAYEWERCNEAGEHCVQVPGVDGSTYRLEDEDLGQTMRALVRASSAAGTNSRVSEATATIESIPEAGAECTDVWVGEQRGDWGEKEDWSTGDVPGASDVACISAGVTIEVGESEEPLHVGAIEDQGTLELLGQLELTNASRASTVGTLELPTFSALTGAGSLDITGSLDWRGGAMSCSGETVLEPGASGTVESFYGTIAERTLLNEGALAVPFGLIELSDGALIENMGTFVDNADTMNSLTSQINVSPESTGAAPRIINTGLFEKTEGSGIGRVAVKITNDGTVQARSGKLEFTAGGVTGEAATGSWGR
jgi:hypothetical protein